MASEFYYEVASLLDIDTETGMMKWKKRGRGRQMGRMAGNYDNGYEKITIKNKSYHSHRIAWLLYYGEMPDGDIDHIHGHEYGNGIWNLRVCTRSQNLMNKRISKNNKSGFKGVFEKKGKWCASISHKNRRIHIGTFATKEDAAKAYNEAAIEYYGEFACLNVVIE